MAFFATVALVVLLSGITDAAISGSPPWHAGFVAGTAEGCEGYLQATGIAALRLSASSFFDGNGNVRSASEWEPVALVDAWRQSNAKLFNGFWLPGTFSFSTSGDGWLSSDATRALAELQERLVAQTPHCDAGCQDRQRDALRSIYASTGGDQWPDPAVRAAWTSATLHHCCYPGVTCCSADNSFLIPRLDDAGAVVDVIDSRVRGIACLRPGAVVALDLSTLARVDGAPGPPGGGGQGPPRSLPADALAALAPSLEYLDARFAGLSGTLPATILRAVLLRSLRLDFNSLSGEFPRADGGVDWAHHALLVHLGLVGNRFSGGLPSELSQALSLEELVVAGNEFVRGMPTAASPALRVVDVSGNRIQDGLVPRGVTAGVASLADGRDDVLGIKRTATPLSLKMLRARANGATGTLPASLTQFDLQVLDLSDNRLTGTIPRRVATLGGLKVLLLSGNALSGTFPELGGTSELEEIDVSNNPALTGTVPVGLRNARDLRMSTTNVFGAIPEQLVSIRLQHVNILDTLMTHPRSAPNERGEFLPSWLTFGSGDDLELTSVLTRDADTGEIEEVDGLLCPNVQPAGSAQRFLRVIMHPSYYRFEGCLCARGYEPANVPPPSHVTERLDAVRNDPASGWPAAGAARDAFEREHVLDAWLECEDVGTTLENWVIPVSVSIGGLVLLVLVVALFLLWRFRGELAVAFMERRKRSGPPSGGRAITLVLTDVEGSTAAWEEHPEDMTRANAVHDAIMRHLLPKWHGYEVTTEGDAFLVAFHEPADAVGWCLSAQAALMAANWPEGLVKSISTDKFPTHPQRQSSDCAPDRAHKIGRSASDLANAASRGGDSPNGFEAQHQTPPRRSTDASRTSQAEVKLTHDDGQRFFRGLLVRMSVATAHATSSRVHRMTRRVEYAGPVVAAVNALQEVTQGGQILIDAASYEGTLALLPIVARTLKALPIFQDFKEWMAARRAPEVVTSATVSRSRMRGFVAKVARERFASQAGEVVSGAGDNESVVDGDGKQRSIARGRGSIGVDSAVLEDSVAAGQRVSNTGDLSVAQRVRSARTRARVHLSRLWDRATKSRLGEAAFLSNGRVAHPEQTAGDIPDSFLQSHLSILDMGEHRIGLPEPTHIYQPVVPLLEERVRFFDPLPHSHMVSAGYLDAPLANMPLRPESSLCPHPGLKTYNGCPHCAGQLAELPEVVIAFCGPVLPANISEREAEKAKAIYRSAVRESLPAFNGYECQELTGAFMIAFHNLADAFLWGTCLQMALPGLPWPRKLLSHESAAVQVNAFGRRVSGGLKARIGICRGRPLRVVPHPATGRADYFGPLVNRAARMCFAAAQGGQVVGSAADAAQALLQVADLTTEDGKVRDAIGFVHAASTGLHEKPAGVERVTSSPAETPVGPRTLQATATSSGARSEGEHGGLHRVTNDKALLRACGFTDDEQLPPFVQPPLPLDPPKRGLAARSTARIHSGRFLRLMTSARRFTEDEDRERSDGGTPRRVDKMPARSVRFSVAETGSEVDRRARLGPRQMWTWVSEVQLLMANHIGSFKLKGVTGEFDLCAVMPYAFSGIRYPPPAGKKAKMLGPAMGPALQVQAGMRILHVRDDGGALALRTPKRGHGSDRHSNRFKDQPTSGESDFERAPEHVSVLTRMPE
ncbi:unnamed protein product [Pedinophyceae sp. YPF-701]|nr:unnamed protein product [Pedinophyceae sp. YPF-701]